MSGAEGADRSGFSSSLVGLAAFGLLAILFALLPSTRPLAFVAIWIAAPAVTFGSLVQVFRGRLELRSGRGIVFAMCCAGIALVAIPVGRLIASPAYGDPVTFFGVLAAIVAVGFARLSVSSDVASSERDVPPIEDVEVVVGASDPSGEGVDRSLAGGGGDRSLDGGERDRSVDEGTDDRPLGGRDETG